ncbi:MAG: flavodoxin reductase, partial [Pedobacter sp.]
FSNKTPGDIIYEKELRSILGDNAIFIVTESGDKGYSKDYINAAFLDLHVDDYKKQFYICGPDPMIKSISDIVIHKGADPHAVIFEK